MPSGYAQTGWQHNADLQKEFERVSRAFSNIDKDIAEIAKAVEPIKKESKKGLTVLHNEELIQEAKKVEILNFLDSENVTYEINSERSNDKSKVENSNATKVNITPRAIIDTCMNEMLGYINLMMNRQLIPLPDTTPYQPPYRAIKCDNPGETTATKASDVNNTIESKNFAPYPIAPSLSGIQNSIPFGYNNYPYRGIKYYNESFNYGFSTFDNSLGYTRILITEPGLYKVNCIFTGQHDVDGIFGYTGNMERSSQVNEASAEGETIVELMLMKNGVFNSLLNAMRVANKSVHLQGQDLVFLEAGDNISIGFKAYEQIYTARTEINLIWGTIDHYIPLYSHLTVERISDRLQTYSNAGHTYSEEW